MKTILFSILAIGIAVTTEAQTTIKANFNKGDTTIYETVSNIKMELPMGAGNKEFGVTTSTRYVVLDKTNTGYRLERTITKADYKGNKEIANQMGNSMEKYLTNTPVILQTDTNGTIIKIENYDDVVGKASSVAIAELEKLYSDNPQIEAVMPKTKAIMSISAQLEEKNIIDNINEVTFLSFYGKKINNGDKEDRTLQQGIKAVTTYSINKLQGNIKVTGLSKSNMTENDVKQMMIANMKKMGMGEEVTSQIENNWGQMKAMGMTNLDFDSVDNYNFLPSGWISDSTTDGTVKMMGMNMKITVKTNLDKKNW